MSIKKMRVLSSLVLIIGLFFCSCTQNTPQILGIETRIVNVSSVDEGTLNKQMEIYLHLDSTDEDPGIRSLLITAPEKYQLTWTIDVDYLFTESIDQEIWIGSNTISAPTSRLLLRRFPQGTYQATIIFENGYEDSIEFQIRDSVTYSERTSELFSNYDNSTGMILSNNPSIEVVLLRAYDDALNPLGSLEIPISTPLIEQKSVIDRSIGRGMIYFELEIYNEVLHQWFRSGYFRMEESD